MRFKKQKTEVTARDKAIFLFLWRWKFATTAALTGKFFPGGAVDTAYKRLRVLQNAGYLRFESLDPKYYWTLTWQGFALVRPQLPRLGKIRFKSEDLAKDALVNAIHLGEWLTGLPEKGELVTAHELTPLPTNSLPDWVPSRELYTPDGYWRFVRSDKLFTYALKVELPPQRNTDYSRPAHFFEWQKSVHRTIWLVTNLSSARRIQAKLKSYCPETNSGHNFLTLKEFLTDGWEAKFCLGLDRNKSLRSRLMPSGNSVPDLKNFDWRTPLLLDASKTASKTMIYHPAKKSLAANSKEIAACSNRVSNATPESGTHTFLNMTKNAGKPRASRAPKKHKKCNRLGFYPSLNYLEEIAGGGPFNRIKFAQAMNECLAPLLEAIADKIEIKA